MKNNQPFITLTIDSNDELVSLQRALKLGRDVLLTYPLEPMNISLEEKERMLAVIEKITFYRSYDIPNFLKEGENNEYS